MNSADSLGLLDRIAAFIRCYMVLSPAQLTAVTLWVAHTHCFDAADTTPYLSITSAEKQCGKSRLLEVLDLIVRCPWLTARVSAAVLPRKIQAEQPTLLLDESDTAFGGQKDYAEALRGILNSGHRRGGCVSLCAGQGTKITYKNFDTFCPKAIAGIGQLPDTIADRSIPIRLKRRISRERVERFRRRDVMEEATRLAKDIEAMSRSAIGQLRDARPALPDCLGDRQLEAIEPLLAIADLAGGVWPEKSRASFVELFGVEAVDTSSVRVRLLADIRAVLWRKIKAEKEPGERIASKELLRELNSDETSEWADWNHGKGLSPSALAKFLRPYGISPKTVRLDGETLKGYEWRDFEDAWARYLPSYKTTPAALDPPFEMSQPSQRNINASDAHVLEPSQRGDVTSQKSEQSTRNMLVVTAVTASSPENRQEDAPFDSKKNCYVHGQHGQWWQQGENRLCGLCHPTP